MSELDHGDEIKQRIEFTNINTPVELPPTIGEMLACGHKPTAAAKGERSESGDGGSVMRRVYRLYNLEEWVLVYTAREYRDRGGFEWEAFTSPRPTWTVMGYSDARKLTDALERADYEITDHDW